MTGNTAKLTGISKWLYNRGVAVKRENLLTKGRTTHTVYDKLIFNKMAAALGGNVRLMITASAPISTEVLTYMRLACCAPILEAYGQTEGTGGEFVTDEADGTVGHVGGPTTINEFKLLDVPEMKYTSKDVDAEGKSCPRGEICVRGMNVIPGYYKNAEKNQRDYR